MHVRILDQLSFTQKLDGRVQIGTAQPVEVINVEARCMCNNLEVRSFTTNAITDASMVEQRKTKLTELF